MGDDHGGDERTDEYDFLRIGRKQKFDGVQRALARVKSMVRDPKARDQYVRLVQKFDNFKVMLTLKILIMNVFRSFLFYYATFSCLVETLCVAFFNRISFCQIWESVLIVFLALLPNRW